MDVRGPRDDQRPHMQKRTVSPRIIGSFIALAGLSASAIVSCSQASDAQSHVDADAGASEAGASEAGASSSSRGGSATGGLPDLAVSMAGESAGGEAGSAVCDAQV